jgi:hypothetical protein
MSPQSRCGRRREGRADRLMITIDYEGGKSMSANCVETMVDGDIQYVVVRGPRLGELSAVAAAP